MHSTNGLTIFYTPLGVYIQFVVPYSKVTDMKHTDQVNMTTVCACCQYATETHQMFTKNTGIHLVWSISKHCLQCSYLLTSVKQHFFHGVVNYLASSMVLRPTRQITGHFGDESFQTIYCITDNPKKWNTGNTWT